MADKPLNRPFFSKRKFSFPLLTSGRSETYMKVDVQRAIYIKKG